MTRTTLLHATTATFGALCVALLAPETALGEEPLLGDVLFEGPVSAFSTLQTAASLSSTDPNVVVDPTIVDLGLIGALPGDRLYVEQTGSMQFNYTLSDQEGHLIGVFSADDQLNPVYDTVRVPQAIQPIEVLPWRSPYSTEYFVVSLMRFRSTPHPLFAENFQGIQLDVPATATHLFVAQHDLGYGDNIDHGLGVRITRVVTAVENTPPTVQCSPGGTYQAGMDQILVDGAISDLDADTVSWAWYAGDVESGTLLASGSADTLADGEPVNLATIALDTGYWSDFYVGQHSFTLVASDEAGSDQCTVSASVTDTVAPTLAPDLPHNCPLWPPNHAFEQVCVDTNAMDVAGAPVSLAATISSSEPADDTGDGSFEADFGAPVIEGDRVCVDLRRERAGSTTGRTYTFGIDASDPNGNTSSTTVECKALHDKRK